MHLKQQYEEMLDSSAQALLAHQKWYESVEPEARSTDDEGLYELGKLYMILYSLHRTGTVPDLYKADEAQN